jgi:hypothetical protein
MACRRVNLSSSSTNQILADSLLDFMNDSVKFILPNKAESILISNISIDDSGYSWKGNLSQLKSLFKTI